MAFLHFRAFSQNVILCLEEGFGKIIRMETVKIVLAFAETDPLDRHMQLFMDREDHAAFGRAIELGQDDPCGTISPKFFAWLMAFCPVVASRTRSV